jgi:predicted phosphoadenosine phosphosulfate sulfurtransferase
MKKIEQYLNTWKSQGYSEGIPDEVPSELARLRLAPSYKAIATAILSNDLHFVSLGFTTTPSQWYAALKKVEIAERNKNKPWQNLELPL